MRLPNRTGRSQYGHRPVSRVLSAFSHCIEHKGLAQCHTRLRVGDVRKTHRTNQEAAPGFHWEQLRGGRPSRGRQQVLENTGANSKEKTVFFFLLSTDHDTC